jgi:hypothetical protein
MPVYGTEQLLLETFDSIRDFDHIAVSGVKEKDMLAVLARLRQMPNLTSLEFLNCDLSKLNENSPVLPKVRDMVFAQQGEISQGTIRWLAKFPKGVQLVIGWDVPELTFDDLGEFAWVTFDNCKISRSALKLVGSAKVTKVTFKEITLVEIK